MSMIENGKTNSGSTVDIKMAGYVELPPEADAEAEIMMRAAALHNKYEVERRENQELLAKAYAEIKYAQREIEFLTLELAQTKNDLSASQSQCELHRQEVADVRALFSSIRAQLDHFEIPLPMRKKVRNGHPK